MSKVHVLKHSAVRKSPEPSYLKWPQCSTSAPTRSITLFVPWVSTRTRARRYIYLDASDDPSAPTRIVVTDTNVLINLIHVDRLGLLGALSGYKFVVPPEVESEVITPSQTKALARAFDAGHLHRRPLVSASELTLYASQV